MQDCNPQLNLSDRLSRQWAVWLIVLTIPVVCYGITLLMPTFDDFTYFTAPYPKSLSERLIPFGSYWRPFDALFGYFIERHVGLFPLANHLCVFAGHIGNTFLLYRLLERLKVGPLARNFGLLYFYMAPGVLGTVLDIDSLNQTYSLLFDLMGLLCFVSLEGRWRLVGWIACTYMATLFKENGIMWFVIMPLLASMFLHCSKKTIFRFVAVGMCCALLYVAVRLSFPVNHSPFNHEYIETTFVAKLKDLFAFIGLTFLPLDYVALVHDRNYLWAACSAVFTLSFFGYVSVKNHRTLFGKTGLLLLLCMLIAAAPHLATVFTAMHAYGLMPLMAMLWALIINRLPRKPPLLSLMTVSLFTIILIDLHHWNETRLSGQRQERLSKQALRVLGAPVDSVFSINIVDGYRKYSTFCVRPTDAFAWGNGVQLMTAYRWPKTWEDVSIPEEQRRRVPEIADSAYRVGFRKVLLISHETVTLIAKRNAQDKQEP